MAKDTEKNKIHFENQKIIPVDLEREMKKSYIDYAMSSWAEPCPMCATV